jgi:glycosyltransferase involved in cell wall biosynthesis
VSALSQENLTFLIPSIGRPTLARAIASLYKQTIPDWKAIVCFDNTKPTIETNDKVFVTQFTGNISGWRAGIVRNFATRFITTPWIGLLDDDDSITPDYLEKFQEYSTQGPDIIVFQMMFSPDKILPRGPAEMFTTGRVGVSFAFRREILNKVQFAGMKCEDVRFLRDARMRGFKVILCPHVTYHVNH